jgi:hypothetical protein
MTAEGEVKKGVGRDERWMDTVLRAGETEERRMGRMMRNGVMENERGHRLRFPFHADLPPP